METQVIFLNKDTNFVQFPYLQNKKIYEDIVNHDFKLIDSLRKEKENPFSI